MTPLEGALWAAEKGIRVFPLVRSREGKLIPKEKDPFSKSSCDPLEVEMMGAEAYGVDCGNSNLVVVDIDNKDGKDGNASWLELIEGQPTIDSAIMIHTPSEGTHIYLEGKTRSRIGMMEGLDIKSSGGYVVAPGSTKGRKPYTVFMDAPITPAPVWLTSKIGEAAPPSQGEKTPVSALDTDANKAAAKAFLLSVDPAVEGNCGDSDTYKTACRVKDFGISKDVCLQMMLYFFNPRCDPPWGEDELEAKVKSAYKSGQNAPGCDSPELLFKEERKIKYTLLSEVKWRPEMSKKWFIEGRSVAKYVTSLLAPGGLGKTTMSLYEALALATDGKVDCGAKVVNGCSVWVHTAEDPIVDLESRFVAMAIEHDIRLDQIKHQCILTSSRECDMTFSKLVKGSPVAQEATIREVIEVMKERKIGVMYLDPFVQCHGLNENDNMHMAHLAGIFQRITEEANCSIVLVHHNRKAKEGESASAESGRGAVAIVSACRVVYGVREMNMKEALEEGIADTDRRNYIKVEGYKSNLTAPMESKAWYRRSYVTMPDGQPAGVLRVASKESMSAISTDRGIELVKAIDSFMVEDSIDIRKAAKFLRERPDTPLSGHSEREALAAIHTALSTPVELDGGTYAIENDTKTVRIVKRVPS